MAPTRDLALASALIRAETYKRHLLAGDVTTLETIAAEEGVTAPYIARMIRIAFLDPGLKHQILDGRQPEGLTLQRLMTRPIPLVWAAQQTLYRS